MKKMKAIASFLLAVVIILFSAACGKNNETLKNIEQPKNLSTVDEVKADAEINAVEPSPNVNGMRFSCTLYEFTERFNATKRVSGENDLIMAGNWRTNGEPVTDNNGIRIEYFYYDDYNLSITATVELETNKLVNIGCGTTMSYFMSQDQNGNNNSDIVLRKAALLAQTACQLDDSSVDVIQSIFYRTVTEQNDSIWYNGFVFSLSTKEDKSDSKNSIMLFRVFPISDDLKAEWKLEEFH